MLVVLDAGYDVIRLAHLLADLPVELLGRLRGDRVFHAPAPPRGEGPGRPSRHGAEVRLADPASHPTPDAEHQGTHPRYGAYTLRAFGHLHPRLTRRGRLARPRRPAADRRGHHHRRAGRAPAR